MKAKCLNPTSAWVCGVVRSKQDGVLCPNMVFNANEALAYASKLGIPFDRFEQLHGVSVPCGKCMACQIRKRKEMSLRLSCEASMYDSDKCCFITLTYDDEHVPVTDFNRLDSPCLMKEDIKVEDDGSMSVDCAKVVHKAVERGVGELPLQTLYPRDVQKFIKRLRRYLEYVPKKDKNRVGRDHVDTSIRYFCVGEYGSKFKRPHYHLMIFGWSPSDMTFWERKNSHVLYRSRQIERLWKYGFSTVSPVGQGVAKYCSRYVTKKFARLQDEDCFKDSVFPEFCLQSIKGGGIGAPWFDDNYDSILANGFVEVRANTKAGFYRQAIPQYFMRRARKYYLCRWLQLRDERMFLASSASPVGSYGELMRSVMCYEQSEREAAQRELF